MNHLADKINQWRIAPRLMVLLYGIVFYQTIHWFMALPEPNGPQSAFIASIIGAGAAFFGFYVNSGAK